MKRKFFYFYMWILCLVLIFPSVFLNVTYAYNPPAINDIATYIELFPGKEWMYVDGSTEKLDLAPFLADQSTGTSIPMVPIQSVAEHLGYSVRKNQNAQCTTIYHEDHEIKFIAESVSVWCRTADAWEEHLLEIAPVLIGGQMAIPAQAWAYCPGVEVYWSAAEERLLIASQSPGAKQTGLDRMMQYLRETGKADNGLIVAVIDSGVDTDHIYLRNRIVYAYNAADYSKNVSCRDGHGTLVAGIIANSTPKGVKIMPIQVTDQDSNISSDTMCEAIRYAVEHGAKIINISVNAESTREGKRVSNAINAAVKAGCTVVVSAGNYSGNVSNDITACSQDAIIVTSVDSNGNLLGFSNYGNTVSVGAPGDEIISTLPGSTFGRDSGTSMSAPYVSAAAAMLSMDNSGITPTEIKNLIMQYSQDRGDPGWDAQYGSGALDLRRYVDSLKKGIVEDFLLSVREKTAQLDLEIVQVKEELTASRLEAWGFFQKPLFAAELVDRANILYAQGEYFSAGYYLEQAIRNNDCSKSTARNNLAYMIRRGEYVSNTFTLERLLSDAKADGQPFAYVNDALLHAGRGEWETADRTMREVCSCFNSTLGVQRIITKWKSLSNRGEAEGDLVLGWLTRYQVYKDSYLSQSEFLDRAKAQYPDCPQWLYEPAKVNDVESIN